MSVPNEEVPQSQSLGATTIEFRNAEVTADEKGSANNDPSDSRSDGELSALPQFDLSPNAPVNNIMAYDQTNKQHQTKASYQDPSKDTNDSKDVDVGQTYNNPGAGIYNYHFGTAKEADYSVGLHVPQATKRYKATYHTTLTWSLQVGPQ
jgi:hypothetical protein